MAIANSVTRQHTHANQCIFIIDVIDDDNELLQP